MKKIPVLLIAAALSIQSFCPATLSEWTVDSAHSQLGFSATLFMISDIKGTFLIKESVITATKEDFSDAVVSIVADVNSIDTDNDQRDNHLRTAEYFDTGKFPTASFKSTSFTKISEGRYQVAGNLNLHGITKPVTFEASVRMGTHPVTKKDMAGFKVTGTISRTDFGISTATPAAMLSDDIRLEANLQFARN